VITTSQLKSYLFVIGLLIFSIFLKLFITSSLDMPSIAGGHDDYWCVRSSLSWYWLNSNYDQMLYIKEPFWPLIMAFTRVLGVPLRLALEIMLFTTAIGIAVFSNPLFTNLRKTGFVLIFSLCFFSPVSINCFQNTTYDAFFGMLFALSVSLLVPLARYYDCSKKSYTYEIFYGVIIGLLSITRGEGAIVILCGIVPAVLISINFKSFSSSIGVMTRRFVLILVITCFIQAPIRILNYYKLGSPCISEQTESKYIKAMNALASIDTGNPLHGAVISKKSIECAAGVSHSCRELALILDSDIWRFWEKVHLGVAPPYGEIGSGYITWAIRDHVSKLGYFASPLASQGFFDKIQTDLNNSFAEGRLKKRFVIHPLIGPPPPLMHVLNSFLSIIKYSFFPASFKPKPEFWDPQIQFHYDIACNRKSVFFQKGLSQVCITGSAWNKLHPSPLVNVEFISENGIFTNGSISYVKGAEYPCGGGVVAFNITFPNIPGKLNFTDFNGQKVSLNTPLYSMPDFLSTWSFHDSKFINNWNKNQYHEALYFAIRIFWVVGNLLLIPLVLLSRFNIKENLKFLNWHLRAVVAIFFLITIRILMMSLIDCTAFHMRDFRYIFPITLNMPLCFATLGILLSIPVATFRSNKHV
jgi:hypothetical protein